MKSKKKPKIDLKQEAKKGSKAEVDNLISEEMMLELCPRYLRGALKTAKTPAARADLLFSLDRNDLKEARDEYNALDKFVKILGRWFIQEFSNEQRGVTGKFGRVEIKSKDVGAVEDWTKFYKYIAKTGEFDLLNKAVNQRAVKERFEQNKKVPGLGVFVKKVISLTQAKEKK